MTRRLLASAPSTRPWSRRSSSLSPWSSHGADRSPLPRSSLMHLALAGLILVPLALHRAARPLRLSLVVLAVVSIVRFGGEWVSVPPARAADAASELGIVSWNLELGARPGPAAVDGLRGLDVDVVALQELGPAHAAAIEARSGPARPLPVPRARTDGRRPRHGPAVRPPDRAQRARGRSDHDRGGHRRRWPTRHGHHVPSVPRAAPARRAASRQLRSELARRGPRRGSGRAWMPPSTVARPWSSPATSTPPRPSRRSSGWSPVWPMPTRRSGSGRAGRGVRAGSRASGSACFGSTSRYRARGHDPSTISERCGLPGDHCQLVARFALD